AFEKTKTEKLARLKKGAMDNFVAKEPHVSSNNQSHDQGLTVENNVDPHRDEQTEKETNDEDEIGTTSIDVNANTSPVADVGCSFHVDIFDPTNWGSLDPKQIDILAQKGPKRDSQFQKGPKDRYSRRFFALFYTRILSKGEHCDRDWLVYSKDLNRVLCFGCKLFTKGHRQGQLANEGCDDWIHVGSRLKEHETSADHVLNMTTW
uniref:TTF-type domain-containing protein n=1 Tax=Aegilops tauschii subsp. strangulata TaxID=200361 RepID=A0A452XG87_AEGTS